MGKRGERSETTAYFELYAAMGPERSLEKLARQLHQEHGKPTLATWISKLKKASRDHHWQDRVVEYDRQVIREKRRKRDAAIDRMNEEHALLGRTHALRAAKMLTEFIDANRFSTGNAITLLKIATDLERVARGAETEITRTIEEQPKELRHTIAFDLSQLTDAQLAKLEEIASEVESPDED